jgi:hypothetical protein
MSGETVTVARKDLEELQVRLARAEARLRELESPKTPEERFAWYRRRQRDRETAAAE